MRAAEGRNKEVFSSGASQKHTVNRDECDKKKCEYGLGGRRVCKFMRKPCCKEAHNLPLLERSTSILSSYNHMHCDSGKRDAEPFRRLSTSQEAANT